MFKKLLGGIKWFIKWVIRIVVGIALVIFLISKFRDGCGGSNIYSVLGGGERGNSTLTVEKIREIRRLAPKDNPVQRILNDLERNQDPAYLVNHDHRPVSEKDMEKLFRIIDELKSGKVALTREDWEKVKNW